MKNIGTFYDRVTDANYDLYQINAIELKKMLDRTLKLTNLKMAMFNESSRLLAEISSATSSIRTDVPLKFDYVKGIAHNMEEFIENNAGYQTKTIAEVHAGETPMRKGVDKYHQMGYEIMPLAVSAKDKVLSNDVRLLDGFRRMYYVNEIPDIDVFVKVYDELSSYKWQNAMLLFNSWKIANGGGYDLFVDRGYKFGLYTYFGIDVTLYDSRSLKLFEMYTGNDIYTRLKGSRVAHIDLKTSLEMYNKYVEVEPESQEIHKYGEVSLEAQGFNFEMILKEVYRQYGIIREIEYYRGTQEHAKIMTIESFEEFISGKEMQKHIKKIKGMKVTGHTENYIKKHITIHILNYFRKIYDVYGDIDIQYYDEYRRNGKGREFDRITNEQFIEERKELEEKLEKQRNGRNKIDAIKL